MDILLLVVSAICGAPKTSTRRLLDLSYGEGLGTHSALMEIVSSQSRLHELPASPSIRNKVNDIDDD